MSVVLSPKPLRGDAAWQELSGDGLGGAVVFRGAVRPDRVGRKGTVRALLYEADPVPATRILEALGRSVARRHGADRWVIWHRFGTVEVGEVAVIIGAAARHRTAAFETVRELIDRVKDEVPLWKTVLGRPARRPRRPRSRRAARSAGSGRAPRSRAARRRAG